MLGLFSGCKKTAEEEDKIITCPPPQSLAGTWELRELQSSMLPLQTFTAGNGNKLVLTYTTYEFSAPGQVTKSGQYTPVADTAVTASVCLNLPDLYYRVVFDSNYTATKTYFSLQGNKLKLVSGCFALDAGVLKTYEKAITQ